MKTNLHDILFETSDDGYKLDQDSVALTGVLASAALTTHIITIAMPTSGEDEVLVLVSMSTLWH